MAYTVGQLGLYYTDKSVASLTTNQAAGTEAVLPVNFDRRGFTIMPNGDGKLYYTGDAVADGPYLPIYAGVPKTLTGADCPTNPFYVTGQTAGTKLRMAEA